MSGESVRKGHFAMGMVGLGLLRHWLDADRTADRMAELRFLLEVVDDDELSPMVRPVRYDVEPGYARWADSYDAPGNPLVAVEEPVLAGLLPPHREGAVAVDAACGTGRVSRLLAERGYAVRGIDVTEAMLRHARAQVPGASFAVGALESLPLPDGVSDLTTCCLALGHVPDARQVVAELVRVTRSGGAVILSDLHPTALLAGGTASFPDGPGRHSYVPSHVHPISEQLAAFRAAGLDVVDCVEPIVDPVLDTMGPEPLRPAFAAALGGLPIALVWSLRRR